jgi:hypothetical protein
VHYKIFLVITVSIIYLSERKGILYGVYAYMAQYAYSYMSLPPTACDLLDDKPM